MTAPARLLPVLLLLAACQAGGEGPAGATPAAPEIPAAQTPGAAPAQPPAPARPAATPLAPLSPGRRPESAAALLGADAEAVIGALGPPLLRRSEGSAEIWLYVGSDCHLDIVFYPGEDGGTPRVAHAAARSEGGTPRSEAACLAGIARRPA